MEREARGVKGTIMLGKKGIGEKDRDLEERNAFQAQMGLHWALSWTGNMLN